MLLLLAFTRPSSAQSLQSLESTLARSFDRINECYRLGRQFRVDPEKSAAYADSLREASEDLRRYLLQALPLIPESIDAPIATPENLWLTTSADTKLRTWAWDTKTGGEQPQIVMLFEYRTASGVKVVDLRPTGATGYAPDWYDTIYTVTTRQGETYYIPFVNSQFTASKVAQRLDAYTISEGLLRKGARLFQTTGGPAHSIELRYDYFKNYSEKLGRERFKIKFSNTMQTLSVPVAIGDSLTSSNRLFEFDGNRYIETPQH